MRYWAGVLAVITVFSFLVAVLFVWIDQRAGAVAALAAGVVAAPLMAWAVARAVKKRSA